MNKRVKRRINNNPKKKGRKEGRKEEKEVIKKINPVLCISMCQAVIHIFITNKLQ